MRDESLKYLSVRIELMLTYISMSVDRSDTRYNTNQRHAVA